MIKMSLQEYSSQSGYFQRQHTIWINIVGNSHSQMYFSYQHIMHVIYPSCHANPTGLCLEALCIGFGSWRHYINPYYRKRFRNAQILCTRSASYLIDSKGASNDMHLYSQLALKMGRSRWFTNSTGASTQECFWESLKSIRANLLQLSCPQTDRQTDRHDWSA